MHHTSCIVHRARNNERAHRHTPDSIRMNIQLHKNAKTIPTVVPIASLHLYAFRLWQLNWASQKTRSAAGRSAIRWKITRILPTILQTTLTPASEIVATARRTTLRLPLDDLPVIVRDLTPIESTFVTARPRTAKARGYMNRDSMLAMVFKLSLSAQKRSANQGEFKLLAMSCKASIFETVLE